MGSQKSINVTIFIKVIHNPFKQRKNYNFLNKNYTPNRYQHIFRLIFFRINMFEYQSNMNIISAKRHLNSGTHLLFDLIINTTIN